MDVKFPLEFFTFLILKASNNHLQWLVFRSQDIPTPANQLSFPIQKACSFAFLLIFLKEFNQFNFDQSSKTSLFSPGLRLIVPKFTNLPYQ